MSDTTSRSIDHDDMPGPTKPLEEHEWLQQLLGTWDVSSVMANPDGTTLTTTGRETCTSLGGLWAYSEGRGKMPNGEEMRYFSAIGFDVSFKEYRGCWFADVSSHLWKYVGEMSEDKKTLTMTCEGPDMMKDGATMMYRDVIEIVSPTHRTLTSFGHMNGEWVQFLKSDLTKVG